MTVALWFLTAVAVFNTASHAAADERRIDTPLCKQTAFKIVENTKAAFHHFGSTGKSVWFSHPMARSIILDCGNPVFLNVSVETMSPFPDDLWFWLAAEAGNSISSASPEQINPVIMDCQKEALLSGDGVAYREMPKAHIECYATTSPERSAIYFFSNIADDPAHP